MRKKRYPWFPITSLIFFLTMYLLSSLGLIISPEELLGSYENFYLIYGLLGLSLIVFLEGIVYLGIYSPGSSILVFSVITSQALPLPFFLISLTTGLVLTLTSLINYALGKLIGEGHTIIKQSFYDSKLSKRGLFWSCLHPNILAFYFFNEGMGRKSLSKLWKVPLIATSVGFFYTLVFYLLSSLIGYRLERFPIMLLILLIWLILRLRKDEY